MDPRRRKTSSTDSAFLDVTFGAATTCTKCGGKLVQRTDDNSEIVLERLKVYLRQTKPVLEFYRERSTFRVVNGAQAPERVAHEMDSLIDDAAAAGVAMKTERLPL